MNKLKAISLSFMLCLFLFACGNKGGDDLNRTWQVTDIQTSTDLVDSVRTSMITGSQMTFSKDGKYTTTGGIGADQGTYTLDKEGNTLSTVSTSGKDNEVYTIDKLDKTNLKLTNNGNTITCIAAN